MIEVIVGKPGSGKSYLAVKQIAEKLCDWCAYEVRNSTPFQMSIYTNLKLNLDACQDYIKRHLGQDVDVKKYITLLDSDFFLRDGSAYEWWHDIPSYTYVVLDEVHELIPSVGIGGKDYMASFTKYISQHRHQGQDITFITQHTDTIHKNILCMASKQKNVVNVKTKTIPFLGIPIKDLDVVKEAFGFYTQAVTIVEGNYINRALHKDAEYNILLIPEIFALYKSHAYGNADSDTVSLNLSPVGSLFWFAKKHALQLGIKCGIVFILCRMVFVVMVDFPQIISSSIKPEMNPSVQTSVKLSEKSLPCSSRSEEITKEIKEGRILIYGKDYVVTESGKKRIGEILNGKKIQSVDYVNRSVFYQRLPDSKGVNHTISGELSFSENTN
ncbi:MAG: zonular occludens toxin domain-containing protein [Planctomycetia bacterium]|nr:zonular occludens toxin domain-containing protein [Planctomycetia bacterium]